MQSERFKEEVSRTPGPGAYAVSKESDWIRNTHPSKKRQTAFNTGEVRIFKTAKALGPAYRSNSDYASF